LSEGYDIAMNIEFNIDESIAVKRATIFPPPGGAEQRTCLREKAELFAQISKITTRAHQRAEAGVRTADAHLMHDVGKGEHIVNVKRRLLKKHTGGSDGGVRTAFGGDLLLRFRGGDNAVDWVRLLKGVQHFLRRFFAVSEKQCFFEAVTVKNRDAKNTGSRASRGVITWRRRSHVCANCARGNRMN
jgi:hypothetical protein